MTSDPRATPQSGDVVMTVPVTIDDGTITPHDTGKEADR